MRLFRCFLAAALAAGIVTMVAAQPRPGFGGFQQDTYMLVLSNTALQEELKVTDAQKEKFKEISTKQKEASDKANEGLKEKFADAKGDKDKFKEIFEGMQKDQAKIRAEARKSLDSELNADQKKRLKQISIQAVGLNVFGDPDAKGMGFGFGGISESQKELMKEVQTAMKLTDSQKSSIKGITADYNKERQEIYKDAGITFGKGAKVDPEKREAADKKVEKVRKEAWGKVEDLFDDTQKKTWKELTGDAFDTSKLRQPPPKKD